MNWKDGNPTLQLIAGGANAALYRPTVRPETRVGYARLGVVVLCIAAFSAAIAGFSWSTVFASRPVGCSVAIVWFVLSCALSGLSVWIIDNLPKGWTWGRFGFLLCLFAFCSLLSAVNTNFVLMLVFGPEISATIEADFRAQRDEIQGKLKDETLAHSQAHNERVTKATKGVEAVDKEMATQLATLRQQVYQKQAAYSAFLAQYAAVAGRRGPRSKKLQADAAQGELQHATTQLAAAETRLQEARGERVGAINADLHVSLQQIDAAFLTEKTRLEQAITDLSATPRAGFLHRHLALWTVVERDPGFGVLFLLLFFLIESLPLVVGVASPPSDYQQVLADDAAEREAKRNAKKVETAEQQVKDQQRLLQAQAALVNASIERKQYEAEHRRRLAQMGLDHDEIEMILFERPTSTSFVH